MGVIRKVPHKVVPAKTSQPKWKDVLDFGADQPAPDSQADVNERLKRLVRQLQDLNRRVDNLTDRY